jgi:hypothetical protein
MLEGSTEVLLDPVKNLCFQISPFSMGKLLEKIIPKISSRNTEKSTC